MRGGRHSQPPIELINFLPTPGAHGRWGVRAKAAVILAIRIGELSVSEVSARYQLSPEELTRWEEAFDREGLAGLQAKALASQRRSRGRIKVPRRPGKLRD